MKKIAFGMACGLLAVFVTAMMLTMYGRQARQSEAALMLAGALDSSLSGVLQEQNGMAENNEYLVADFLKALLIQANSDSDITVSILDADYKKGILSVEITQKFKHPNGNAGSVSETRTVILDRAQKKEVPKECKNVSFYTADGELYKEYSLPKGAVCTMPAAPKKDGKNFRNWRFINGGSGEALGQAVSFPGGQKYVLSSNGEVYKVLEDTKLIAAFE